jgi:hypothetical protein
MKFSLLRTSAAIAIVLSFGLTALVDAEEPADPRRAPVEQPASVPQDIRATVVTPQGRHQQSATMERQRVPVGDGETVTVLRQLRRELRALIGCLARRGRRSLCSRLGRSASQRHSMPVRLAASSPASASRIELGPIVPIHVANGALRRGPAGADQRRSSSDPTMSPVAKATARLT